MSMIQNGLSGLKASQILLDTASNNIANVNTPGYSRQEGVLVSRQNGSSNLSPGSGDAIAMGTPMPQLQQTETVQNIQELFSFEDLSEVPRLLHAPNFRFPSSLSRRGINEGKVIVEIEIQTDGRAKLLRISSSTHRELEPVAEAIISRARFTKPLVNGQPQKVRGRFPLILEN